MAVAKRVVVGGRVQGVGYRAGCARQARRLGLAGQVRNLADGTVEVLAAGDPDAVAALVDWCRSGPLGAEVSDLVVDEWTGPIDLAGGFIVGS